jgi:hypothetical protein
MERRHRRSLRVRGNRFAVASPKSGSLNQLEAGVQSMRSDPTAASKRLMTKYHARDFDALTSVTCHQPAGRALRCMAE